MNISKSHRIFLWIVSAIGLFGINGLFLYVLFAQPQQMNAAYENPFALAFILEAFILLPVLAFLIAIADLRAPDWKIFIVLSLLGSLAFSIPFSVLLWSRKE